VGSKGILDRRPYHSETKVEGGYSCSEGETIATTYLMGLEIDLGGGS
jgi:hypothetical protein